MILRARAIVQDRRTRTEEEPVGMWWIVDLAIALPISVLAHELAHAMFALALTRGPVAVVTYGGAAIEARVGRLRMRIGLLTLSGGGVCFFQQPRRRSDSALIAAAGPVMSLLLAAAALTFTTLPAVPRTFGEGLALWFLIVNAFAFLITAAPLRHPSGSTAAEESDGLLVVRHLWPAAAERVSFRVPARRAKPRRPTRRPFLVVAVVALLAAVAVYPLGALALAALFGIAYKHS
jgi:hypothetical protein